jgi:hypothetical protein
MHVYFFKYLYILATNLITHCRIISIRKYKSVKKIKIKNVNVDGFSYVYKMVEFHHTKKFRYIIIFILKFQKNWIRCHQKGGVLPTHRTIEPLALNLILVYHTAHRPPSSFNTWSVD